MSATKSSAQLFHVVDVTGGHVISGNNLGVAVDITFNFTIASGGIGILDLTITNRAGTAKNAGEGGGTYTAGILTGFGFDTPSTLTYVPNSFSETLLAPMPGYVSSGIDFSTAIPFTDTNPVGNFDYGATANNPAPGNGLQSGNSAKFEFKFSGATASNFTSVNFFGQNGSDADFGFRYQAVGPTASGSDKFVYDATPPIPEPSTYGMIGAALLGVAIWVKRSRPQKQPALAI